MRMLNMMRSLKTVSILFVKKNNTKQLKWKKNGGKLFYRHLKYHKHGSNEHLIQAIQTDSYNTD